MLIFTPALIALSALLSLTPVEAKSHVKIHLTVPTLIQCQPTTLHWTGGNPPFKLWAQPDSRNPETMSHIVNNGSEHSATWLVDAPAGSRIKIRLVDDVGHWTNSYSVVHLGSDSSCLNPDYPRPTAEGSHPPPPKSEWFGGHVIAVALGMAILGACVAIALLIGGREKKKEEDEVRGEYLPVSGQDIQLSQVGSTITRRTPPTHTLGDDEDEDREEEYRSLIAKRRNS